MREGMPDISFERSMNHNYMILSKCDFFGRETDKSNDYRTRMLLENHIPGLLPVTHRLINGESRYYYKINSLQSLDRLYDKTEIRYNELKCLLSGCVNLFERLEEYLLDGTQIIMEPELIYMNVEKMEPYFVCYPEYEGDVRLSFMTFIDELLTKIDHTDERAVMLGYQVYRYTRNPNYVMSEIKHMMEHVIVKMANENVGLQENLPVSKQHFQQEDFRSQEEDRRSEYFVNTYREESLEHVSEISDEDIPNQKHKSSKIGDLIGGIFCFLVSLSVGVVIAAARVLKMFSLSADNELYLYGAMAMAMMAALLFFSCFWKKRKQDKEAADLCAQEREEEEPDEYQSQLYSIAQMTGKTQNSNYYEKEAYCSSRQYQQETTSRTDEKDFYDGWHEKCQENIPRKNTAQRSYDETVCLGDGIVEERMLYGRINGREVNISLNRLPMTIGKLANVSDFVINDPAVSKMHARFEEHEGRVYVCDLNSTNGTVRNGVLLGVNQSVALEPGDKIRFGRTCFTYC